MLAALAAPLEVSERSFSSDHSVHAPASGIAQMNFQAHQSSIARRQQFCPARLGLLRLCKGTALSLAPADLSAHTSAGARRICAQSSPSWSPKNEQDNPCHSVLADGAFVVRCDGFADQTPVALVQRSGIVGLPERLWSDPRRRRFFGDQRNGTARAGDWECGSGDWPCRAGLF